MLAEAQAELARRIVATLERERLIASAAEVESYSTPRRLAVLVKDVAERQDEVAEELMGPATKIAYKDGVPGPAAIAFAKKASVDLAALRIVETPKGAYIAATSTRPGRHASAVIMSELPKEIAGIYWAKNMYWRAGKPERFVRPVRWLLALLGTDVVPVQFGGYEAGRCTYGTSRAAWRGRDRDWRAGGVCCGARERLRDGGCGATQAHDSQGSGSCLPDRGRDALARGSRARRQNDAHDGVALGHCGCVRAGVSHAAGRSSGDGDARPPELLRGGDEGRQAGAAFSRGAEYGSECGWRGGHPARQRARAAGAGSTTQGSSGSSISGCRWTSA